MSDITQMYMLTRGDHQSMDGFRIWQPGEWVRDETYFERINTGMLGAPYWYETVCYDDPLHAFLDGYKHKDVILWRGERRVRARNRALSGWSRNAGSSSQYHCRRSVKRICCPPPLSAQHWFATNHD